VQIVSEEGVSPRLHEIVEGLFDAASACSVSLPLYHPRQLMHLLKAGRTRRVKAILLHVLKYVRRRLPTA